MINFQHKNHASKKDGRITIYYSFSDIVLGLALLILVVFFIYNYLANALDSPAPSPFSPSLSTAPAARQPGAPAQ